MEKFSKDNREDEITYSVTLKSGINLNSLSLEEIISKQNVKKTRIEFLSMGNRISANNNLYISFNTYGSRYIEYRLSLENEEKMSYYEEQIKEFCESLKPRYSFIAVRPLSMYLFLIVPTIYILKRIFSLILNYYDIHLEIFDSFIFEFLTFSLSIIFLWFIYMKLFPAAQFKIGHGIKRVNDLENFRKVLFASMVLSLVIRLIESAF